MALFDNKKPFSYDVIREGDDVMLSVNLEEYPHIPSIEDDAMVMSKACDMLIKVKDASKIVFIQNNYLNIGLNYFMMHFHFILQDG